MRLNFIVASSCEWRKENWAGLVRGFVCNCKCRTRLSLSDSLFQLCVFFLSLRLSFSCWKSKSKRHHTVVLNESNKNTTNSKQDQYKRNKQTDRKGVGKKQKKKKKLSQIVVSRLEEILTLFTRMLTCTPFSLEKNKMNMAFSGTGYRKKCKKKTSKWKWIRNPLFYDWFWCL